ncbi:MAG: YggS family pyridoxal phosphate-dependent enzyme [Thermotogota bacterium]|nr:YggS family pyridoxal phosphate-dependent enzyme [Thermotogota bacterium]
MTAIQKNFNELISKIDAISKACGRNVDEIKLVAVSKTFPVSDIKEIIEAGHNIFGENKAQEIRDKMELLEGKDIEWHFIGPLQKNKVKYVAGKTKLIHSVESEKIAKEIDKRAANEGQVQDILIEVNVSGEESKHGLKPDKTKDFIEMLQKHNNIRVRGFMTMAPFTDDELVIRETFSGLRLLRDDVQQQYPQIVELSMGMTNDYKIAIEEGATILRIGSAIFGTR